EHELRRIAHADIEAALASREGRLAIDLDLGAGNGSAADIDHAAGEGNARIVGTEAEGASDEAALAVIDDQRHGEQPGAIGQGPGRLGARRRRYRARAVVDEPGVAKRVAIGVAAPRD